MSTPRSAVAIIEAPEGYVTHRRPYLPGKLAYPGELHLLGGGIEVEETSNAAIVRELGEETDMPTEALEPQFLWSGLFTGQDKYEQPIIRRINLFHVAVATADFSVRASEGGELVTIAKTLETIECYKDDMTPFALWALATHIKGEAWH